MPDIILITKAIIDTAESILAGGYRKHPEYFSNPKVIRYNAIKLLFKLGDFTYADKFVQYLQEKGGLNDPYMRISAMPYMDELAKAVPSYRDFVKNELLSVMNADTAVNGRYRGRAAVEMTLAMDYFLPDLVTFFNNTNDKSGTNSFIAGEIAPLKYPPFEVALKSKLTSDQELLHQIYYLKLLLENYGSPSNYQFATAYAVNQQNQRLKLDALDALERYVPATPSVSIPVSTLLDSLYSYTQQSQTLNWLGNSHFATDLTKTLDEAKKHLTRKHADVKDSVKCAKEVRKFQKKVDEAYQKSKEKEKRREKFVTVEGWKFLYYNAQYILDRLPALKKEEEED